MKKNFRLHAALALAAWATSAFAGYKDSYPVGVDGTSRYAYGYLGTAFNSPDNVQYIGCSISAHVSGTYATCEARSLANVTRSCSTTHPDLLAAIRMINDDSFVFFTWDTSYVCTQIITLNYSWSEPKR
jgi:hypothetical protein